MPGSLKLPTAQPTIMSKMSLLKELRLVDKCGEGRARILAMECEFRTRISSHVASLPPQSAKFSKLNTSPFVLMFYARQKGYRLVAEIERDILPAKLFSSMETSAGRMVQEVVLPAYGWESVRSAMHSATSVIDARKHGDAVLHLATLKSGPRCLNDEMSKDIADDIADHAEEWADEAGVDHVEFTYAALYGTAKQSNKKDWHILNNIVAGIGTRFVIESPERSWRCVCRRGPVRVEVTIRHGAAWWQHLGGEHALLETLVALIRSCVGPAGVPTEPGTYSIADLRQIVSMETVPEHYNVSLLQRSQLEWLFFLARHFCDELTD